MSEPPVKFVHRRYLFALMLAAGLFAFHTCILFEAAHYAMRLHGSIHELDSHLAGILIILGCFFMLFTAHCAEAAAWGIFFWHTKLLPTYGDSFYFSLTSMTSLGYGDVVLRHPWRLLGGLTAVNGLLMFGCSTAFLFLIIQSVLLKQL